MAFSSIHPLLVVVPLFAVVFGLFFASILWNARRRHRKLSDEAKRAGAQLMAFLKESQSKLQLAVGQQGASREQMLRDVDEIVAAMEARNIAGNLDELIREEREWAIAEIERRTAI